MKLVMLLIAYGGISSCGGKSAGGPESIINKIGAHTSQILIKRNKPLTVDLEATVDTDEENFEYIWDLGDGSILEGKKITHKYTVPGCYEISLSTKNETSHHDRVETTIRVISDPPQNTKEWEITGIPTDNDLIPRDTETNFGYINLELDYFNPKFETLVVRTFINNQLAEEYNTELCGEPPSLRVPIKAERKARNLEFSLRGLEEELIIGEAKNIVAGDVYLVNGQSNAVSIEYSGSARENIDNFVRSYGSRSEDVLTHSLDSLWHTAVVGEPMGGKGAIGQWPLRMALQLSSKFNIPIGIINSGHGARQIGYFQRNNLNHLDLTTNYGRALDRVTRAKALAQIRAVLFYQGEADRGNTAEHLSGIVKLIENWEQDYSVAEKIYITQIRSGCGGYHAGQLEIRDGQRRLPNKSPNISIMSTTGLDGHSGCHFSYAYGYRELGDRYANLIARDIYSETGQTDVEAINVLSATLESNTIIIKTSSDATNILIDEDIEDSFELRGGSRSITAVRNSGNDILVDLSPGENPQMIGYKGHPGPGPWITNSKGIGLLAFLLPIIDIE